MNKPLSRAILAQNREFEQFNPSQSLWDDNTPFLDDGDPVTDGIHVGYVIGIPYRFRQMAVVNVLIGNDRVVHWCVDDVMHYYGEVL